MVPFMQTDPAALAASIGELHDLDLERGLTASLQEVVMAATTACSRPGPRGWDDSEISALQAYAGIVANLLGSAAALIARVAWPTSCRPPSSTTRSSSKPRAC
jgi:hypothetical protein